MRRTFKEQGREILKQEKVDNSAAAATFRLGEAVQFYKDGWRFGHVKALGTRLRTGMVQVEHPITGAHWVKASDVKTLTQVLKHMKGEKLAFTVKEVAELTGFSRDTVIRLFESEPGVIVLRRPETRGKRRYTSLRIPSAVYSRVVNRITQ